MNATYIDELINKINSGEKAVGSTFKLRSETAQKKIKVKRIDKLQKELKKRSKLFIPTEVAVDFDPRDLDNEEYNSENKFRPALSSTSGSLLLKRYAHMKADVKERFMKKANVKEWDTTPVFVEIEGGEKVEVLTEDDKKVFRMYRVPRIFTLPVANINDSRITGRDYGRDYIIKVDRNKDTGRVEGELPIILKANQLYSQRAYEELEHIRQCIECAKKGTPYVLKSKIDDLKRYDFKNILEKHEKEIFRLVYDQIPFSSDRPSNHLIVYEVPLTMELKIEDPNFFNTLTAEELAKMSRIAAINAEIQAGIDKFLNGTYSGSDKHYDFWELDMVCPLEVEDKENKMLIGKATRYESPQNRLRDEPFAGTVEKLIREAMDKTDDLEKEFMFSVNLQTIDASIDAKIIEVMSRTDLLDDPFVTEKVLLNNKDFISLVWGEAGDEKIADLTAGFSSAEPGLLDSEKAAAQQKQYNFDAIMDSDREDDVPEEEDENKAQAEGSAAQAEGTAPKAETIEIS